MNKYKKWKLPALFLKGFVGNVGTCSQENPLTPLSILFNYEAPRIQLGFPSQSSL